MTTARTNTAYAELFTRWFQFSSFCPMLRIHGNNDKALYNFPPPYLSVLTNYDQLRYHFVPYIYSVSWMVSQAGYTMMRPLVMDFQQDTNVFNIPDQYMFGPALHAVSHIRRRRDEPQCISSGGRDLV